MLSKLLHEEPKTKADWKIFQSVLIEFLHKDYKNIKLQPCQPGGTLGVFFWAYLDNDVFFVKTHLPGRSYYINLFKEASILQVIHGEELRVKKIELTLFGQKHLFLLMNRLEPLRELPSISTVKSLISSYGQKLSGVVLTDLEMHSFEQLIQQGSNALSFLLENGFIKEKMLTRCMQILKPLKLIRDFQICHGDLSNKNIMTMDGKLFVIDWEDAFWGVENYDFCYWLTFFDQRKYYESEMFFKYHIESDKGLALMLLAVILKCQLSIQNGSYKKNSVSIEERISEILSLY